MTGRHDGRRTLAMAAGVWLLASCAVGGPATVDGSDPQRFEASLREVRAELPADERPRFEASLTLIQAKLLMKAADRAAYDRELRRKLDGMTADEIIAEAAETRRSVGDAAVDSIFELKRKLEPEDRERAPGGGPASDGTGAVDGRAPAQPAPSSQPDQAEPAQ
jgi:hypothetical protein